MKSERVSALMAVARELHTRYRNDLIGETKPVLWEEQRDSDSRWVGLTDNYVRVECESTTSLTNEITPAVLLAVKGDIVLARVR